MAKLLQIAISANWGSAGKIAEQIGVVAMSHGWESYIAYGRHINPSKSQLIRIGNKWTLTEHIFETLLLDNQGLSSRYSTKHLIKRIEEMKPDVIHLHNIHGHYINYPILFDYLKQKGLPVVWTLHDCWSFTGRCTHFENWGCEKWKTHCEHCPQKKGYAFSSICDKSYRNFEKKRVSFTTLSNLTIVPVSRWLEGLLQESYFKNSNIHLIQNGIDLNKYKVNKDKSILAKYGIDVLKPYVIGVSSVWNANKGLEDFFELRKLLPMDLQVVMVGLKKEQLPLIPEGVIGIKRTESVDELTALYTNAVALANTTYGDTFPTVNIESLACGTPVVTYRTGGSPEIIDESTGIVVDKGNIQQLADALMTISVKGKESYTDRCRERAVKNFDMHEKFEEYFNLYNSLLNNK